jgi:hypothetical protein
MEFDIENADYYFRPIQAARATQGKLPLSRLYYWSTPQTLPDTSEKVMLCSVPLIDSHGRFLECADMKSARCSLKCPTTSTSREKSTYCICFPKYRTIPSIRKRPFIPAVIPRGLSFRNRLFPLPKTAGSR